MRSAVATVALCCGLLFWTLQPAASQPPTSAAPAAGVDADASSSDDADKHAKRTVCLKEAKDKKLVGLQKTEYLKDCMSADPPKPPSPHPS